jgi:hypothetical protein
VNLKRAFLCSQHAARQMLTQDDGGVILNVGASTDGPGVNGPVSGGAAAGLAPECLASCAAPVDGRPWRAAAAGHLPARAVSCGSVLPGEPVHVQAMAGLALILAGSRPAAT